MKQQKTSKRISKDYCTTSSMEKPQKLKKADIKKVIEMKMLKKLLGNNQNQPSLEFRNVTQIMILYI